VAHDAAARRDDERTEVSSGEIALLPLLEVLGADGVAGLDGAALVDRSFQFDLELTGFTVVDVLEAVDVPAVIEDLEHAADFVRGGRYLVGEMAHTLGVIESRERVAEWIVSGHVIDTS